MIIEQSEQVMKEIKKVFIGKDEIIEKVLMAIYAGGHILLEDAPGVGKTTLALCFFKSTWAFLQTYPVYTGYHAFRYYRIQCIQ